MKYLASAMQTSLHQRCVPGAEELMDGGFLNPTGCNDSNRMDLMVMGDAQRIILCARYDNLGKGAAGAAVQNLNIMLGIKESSGL